LIAQVMGAEVDIETDTVRLRPEKSEVERLWADNKKAFELFGWCPAYAGQDGFRKGLGETVQWFLDRNNLAGYKAGRYNI